MKRVWIAIVIVLAAIAAVVAWQVLKPGEPEPVYQGKRLSRWLSGYSMLSGFGSAPVTHTAHEVQADEAVRQLGTNAIPTLLRLLQARDSTLTSKLKSLLNNSGISMVQWPSAWQRNLQAARAFDALGAKAQSAVPALIAIANDTFPSPSSEAAIEALGNIGPAAKQAVPYLLQWAKRPGCRDLIVEVLRNIDPEAAAKADIHGLVL